LLKEKSKEKTPPFGTARRGKIDRPLWNEGGKSTTSNKTTTREREKGYLKQPLSGIYEKRRPPFTKPRK